MRRQALELAAAHPAWQRWAAENLADAWAPKAVNGLLNSAMAEPDAAESPDSLPRFAAVLATLELTVLLDDCLEACVGALAGGSK